MRGECGLLGGLRRHSFDNKICPSWGRCVCVMRCVCTHTPSNGSSSCTFRAEGKQTSGGSTEARFASLSAASRPPVVPPAQTGGQSQGQRGEDYSRYTSDKRVGVDNLWRSIMWPAAPSSQCCCQRMKKSRRE